jgi:ribosomal protein S18 acetylase RimI-like enzyme
MKKSMPNSEAPRQIGRARQKGDNTNTENGSVTMWRERCLLWQEQDLENALTYFTFIADVTTLASDCRFAGDSETLVACYDGLPFAAIAFHSQAGSTGRYDNPKLITALTRRLMGPREAFYCLVAEDEFALLQEAYCVLETHPEQQMLFRGDPSSLDAGDAARLTKLDLPGMRALARREGMMAFEKDPLARGPWYGVWRNGELVAQGGIHLFLSRAAEIGNIVTTRTHRREGLARQIMAALLEELNAESKLVFLHVFEDNKPALAFYQHLGFRRLRTMYLTRCLVPGPCSHP